MGQLMWRNAPTLDEAKAERIAQIKQEAHRLLSTSDWYVVRKQETGEPIPDDILAYRQAVRAATEDAEEAVEALESVQDVQNYTVTWPEG